MIMLGQLKFHVKSYHPCLKNLHLCFIKPSILKLKRDLEDAEISMETQQKLQNLKKDYYDIVSKHRSDIGITHLEEKKIETDPELPLVTSKPHPLPLKNPTFVRGNRKLIRSWIK